MISGDDIEAMSDLESPDTPMQLRALADDKVAATCAYAADLRAAADEIERLRGALNPFVEAYRQTCLGFGVDVADIYKTANCVSTPYIRMAHYVAAHAALYNRPWSKNDIDGME